MNHHCKWSGGIICEGKIIGFIRRHTPVSKITYLPPFPSTFTADTFPPSRLIFCSVQSLATRRRRCWWVISRLDPPPHPSTITPSSYSFTRHSRAPPSQLNRRLCCICWRPAAVVAGPSQAGRTPLRSDLFSSLRHTLA